MIELWSILSVPAIAAGLLSLVATAVVTVGLVLEYIGSKSDARISWYPLTGGPPPYWDCERIGDWLIILGVVGELLFGIIALVLTYQLDNESRRQIATVSERGAKAEGATEKEKLARLEYEKLYGPRTFTVEQHNKLVKYWHKYAGTTVKVGVFFDPESEAFLEELSGVLREAGLKIEQTNVPSGERGAGVLIVGPFADSAMMNDLSNSLTCEGIVSQEMEICGQPPCANLPSSPQTCDFRIDVFFHPLGSLSRLAAGKCRQPWIPPTWNCR